MGGGCTATHSRCPRWLTLSSHLLTLVSWSFNYCADLVNAFHGVPDVVRMHAGLPSAESFPLHSLAITPISRDSNNSHSDHAATPALVVSGQLVRGSHCTCGTKITKLGTNCHAYDVDANTTAECDLCCHMSHRCVCPGPCTACRHADARCTAIHVSHWAPTLAAVGQ
jgi:hypothetical protein